ncbi:MAG: DctP family TRAP transporter solute-binding subunit [Lachnospiraceae bacterium]|jgi:tripartite ATP-independent transporter DctP family solute receptor|nr:DctP family TRAP transporter solute-binding subunit [Lachnospiraceae bacterium]MCI8994899.1 DctP family TRAP transporter solute-binding subunit [Lachnospiraceae bacterium]MCI9135215.1 DctP family TRAP transporter solute-binding subunit [Lachnospiraceae bacterium]
MKRKVTAILLGLSLIASLTACGSKQPAEQGTTDAPAATAPAASDETENADTLMGSDSATVRFKVGTTTAPEGHYVKGLIEMQSLLEEYSNGEMTLDIYPNSQLGNERDMMENVGMGVQEMCLVSTGPIPNFVSDFAVLDLPYLFETADDAYAVLDGEIGTNLLSQLSSQGIVGLGFWENGFRDVTNDTREIVTPEDLKGMKIRTMENNVHIATYEALGATATPMAWGEIFTALQQGTVDGQENPIAIIESAKVYEVQKYCSLIDLFYSPCVLMISQSVYDGLSDTQKEALTKAADEAKTFQREYSQSYNEDAIKTMEAAGVTVTEVDKSVWKSAINYDDIISKSGLKVDQALLDQLVK